MLNLKIPMKSIDGIFQHTQLRKFPSTQQSKLINFPFSTNFNQLIHSRSSRIWVSYGIGVYDITDFIPLHPGAEKNIMLGAGVAIDPFWVTYQFHQQPKVLQLLEKYRIGNLKQEDKISVENQGDPYDNEPVRKPDLTVRVENPFNAEPPLNVLVENFITPIEYFYGEF